MDIVHYQLAQPWWMLGLFLIPLLWWWKKKKYAIGQESMTYSHISLEGGHTSLRSRLMPFLDALFYLGLAFLVVAMARPQKILAEEKVKADGIDIMLAMDLSSSMLSRDFDPDRLEVSKMVAKEFVEKRKYDRIGLVAFARESYTQCPLTPDHKVIQDLLDQLTVGILDDGTAIGMGLSNAVNRLKDSQAKSRIIILLTDGENNAGYIDPMTASEIAETLGIKVYTIAIGTTGRALSPIQKTADGRYIFGMQNVNINETLLKNISEQTHGKYFRALDRKGLEEIYAEIDRLEKTKIEITVFKRYQDFFHIFIMIGLAFILGWWILKQTYFSLFKVMR